MTDDLDKLAESQRAAWSVGSKARPIARRDHQLRQRNKTSARGVGVADGRCEGRLLKTKCPAWVPKCLVQEWERVLCEEDEFAAAAHVRALKARELAR